MKMFSFILFSSVLVLGCSKSGKSGAIPGAELPEPTAEQKNRASRIGHSYDDVDVLTKTGHESNSTEIAGISFGKNAPTLSKAQQDLQQKMEIAKNTSDCKTTFNQENLANLDAPQKINFEISGPKCPLSIKSTTSNTVSMSANSITMSGTIQETFQANPAGIYNFNFDITDYEMSEAHSASNVATGNNSGRIQIQSLAKINLNSKTEGTVTTELSTQVSANSVWSEKNNSESVSLSFNTTLTQSFRDFKIVGFLSMQVNQLTSANSPSPEMTKSQSFYINGKVVTEEEFIAIFGSVGMDPQI